ncbi:6-phosphofructokinase [Allomyces macrogynus ATCC 38327]|uniref:6-phosphofructokinase n=1 Tax=Allomyces macrogynus (strain ATCC 38327) TaxID=578462 RepID=A0A0L0SE10_ALLM3|nr:6-phosphofructokinase [Allomyces macrogynus ATCC 38327]|eukprot:KNE60672.1 6-phosphofructokinase [Allomyces macrogynus ATCC 38327]
MCAHLKKLKDRGQKKILVIVSEGAIRQEPQAHQVRPAAVPVPYGAHDRLILQQRLGATASPVLPPDVHLQQDVSGPDLSLPVPAIATRKRRIGILTSGGDSQGMNAAVRAVVRMAHVKGLDPWAIYDGYQGLVDNVMRPLAWADVQGLLRLGGTVIGTARCMAFRERAGRLTAAQHLVESGIDALVVIGGDGSLTGADRLRAEWGSLLDELLETQRISQDQRETYAHLNIVGLVGSIDNDMSSTDMTIGCVSALHRICEAVDAIEATALSHGRAFVVEVMGRHCGWLALTAALASAADWLFVPERPPLVDNWEEEMCAHLKKLKDRGQKKILVIVSEGAIDKNLKPIKSEYVRDLLAAKLKFDARVTTLGHVQRGGSPCFYDRYLGTVQGVRAVDEILRATPETPSPMIGISNNKITVEPLVQAVTLTHAVSAAIEDKDFARAMELRDPEFATSFDTFVAMNNLPVSVTGGLGVGVARLPRTLAASPTQNAREVPTPAVPESGHRPADRDPAHWRTRRVPGWDWGFGRRAGCPRTLAASATQKRARKCRHPRCRSRAPACGSGILHIGAPAGGSNAATRAAALLALNRGHTPLAIYNGVEGLVRGDWKPLTRRIVQNWTARGGSELGTNREQPGAQLGLCAYQLQRAGIQALLFVGGFEAFSGDARAGYGSKGRRIGILTSGGDSQGMNAAVRAVVRMAHVKGLDPWAIYDGYQGLVDNVMRPLAWADVQGLLRLGGTVIGTARCMAFRERAGRLTAAQHLVESGIDALVVIGGDGSLTGADRLRAEWGSLLDELLETQRISQDQRETYAHLNIVVLGGTIDNDMSSTDMTIGSISGFAPHLVVHEAIKTRS